MGSSFHYTFIAESGGEIILKSDQKHLATLSVIVLCPVFVDSRGINLRSIFELLEFRKLNGNATDLTTINRFTIVIEAVVTDCVSSFTNREFETTRFS